MTENENMRFSVSAVGIQIFEIFCTVVVLVLPINQFFESVKRDYAAGCATITANTVTGSNTELSLRALFRKINRSM